MQPEGDSPTELENKGTMKEPQDRLSARAAAPLLDALKNKDSGKGPAGTGILVLDRL